MRVRVYLHRAGCVLPAGFAKQGTDEPWPELLTVLFQLSIAEDPGKRESAFRVFNTTPGIIEKQHHEAVGQAFTKGFKDESVGVCLYLAIWITRGNADISHRSASPPWRRSLPSSGA